MSAGRHKAVVRAFVEAVNRQQWARLEALVAPGFVRHSDAAGAPGVRSRDDLLAFLRAELATFPDATEVLEDLVAEGDRVAARHRFVGTQLGPLGPHPPTGRTMTATYLAIYRIEDGRIAECWAEWDNLHGLAQPAIGGRRPGEGAARGPRRLRPPRGSTRAHGRRPRAGGCPGRTARR